jgi:hypothetical protein
MADRTAKELIETLISDVEKCWALLQEARHETEFARKNDIREAVPEEMHDMLPTDIVAFLHRDYEFHARQFFRATFAFIEGITYALKTRAAHYCLAEGIELTDGEIDFVAERDYKVNNNGTVTEQSAHIRLADNVRLAIAICEKARRMPPSFDANIGWWSGLMAGMKVRDRLMHPKIPEDLDISHEEVNALFVAYKGMLEHFRSYPKLVYTNPPVEGEKLVIRRS